MECIEITLNGNPDFGRKSTVQFTRNGDLVTKVYLMITLPAVSLNTVWTSTTSIPQFAWVRRLGHAIVLEAELTIGGARIDKHYSVSYDVLYELTRNTSQERGYSAMIGDVSPLTRLDTVRSDGQTLKDSYIMYVPMQFWFNKNPGLALPLIALQYHEVRIDYTFASLDSLTCRSQNLSLRDINFSQSDFLLLADFVYLDVEERNRFAQSGHEYLIEQLQFTGTESAQSESARIKLGFSHPTKYLAWAMVNGLYINSNVFLAYTHEDDWTAALNYAVESIALGMVRIDKAVAPLADTRDRKSVV